MCHIFSLITFILLFLGACVHTGHKTQDDTKVNKVNGTKIPSWWIDKVSHFNYTRDDTALLKQFNSFVKSDTLSNPHAEHVDPGYGRVFNVLFADIDGDANNELICLLGWDVTSPDLCVFKQIQGNWYLIYRENIDTFYNSPTLYVANCFSKNKTFYLKRVYDHGSGVYIDGYSFYKLIGNKVYKCLDIINDAHIYGWGLYMNQSVKVNFEFSGDENDELGVDYVYNFFPGSVNENDCPWCAHEDIPLISGDDNVPYEWDSKQHIYKLAIPSYNNKPENLTAQKIACFGDFGNDTLFVKAFHDQIDETLKTGTLQQKRILKKYLAW